LEEYVFSRGVNSKTTIGTNEKASLKKIRIVDILDMIRDDTKVTFKKNYQGKVNNSLNNKNLLVSAYNSYLRGLVTQGALSETEISLFQLDIDATTDYLENEKGIDCSSMTSAEILAIGTDSSVSITGAVYVDDAMEDLNLILNY